MSMTPEEIIHIGRQALVDEPPQALTDMAHNTGARVVLQLLIGHLTWGGSREYRAELERAIQAPKEAPKEKPL